MAVDPFSLSQGTRPAVLWVAIVFCLLGYQTALGTESVALEVTPSPVTPVLEASPAIIEVRYAAGLLSVSAKDADIRALVEDEAEEGVVRAEAATAHAGSTELT